MEFITDRIMTQPGKSLQEIAKEAQNAPKMRSLEEILEAQKQVKTAASNAAVKTAGVKTAEVAPAEPTKEPEPAKEPEPEVEEVKEAPKAEAKAKTTKTLRMAKSLDFRAWKEPSDVVLAWSQHGSMEKCQKNVEKLTNDPKMYCGLLEVAADEAQNVIKTAAQKTKTTKTAGHKFTKLSELPKKEKAWLSKYWATFFPPEYVEAMLGEF